MRIFKLHPWRHIPDDWHEQLVPIWQEDDACRAAHDETREHIYEAWERITGISWEHRGEPIARYDGGDIIFTLYRSGWVEASSYDGDALLLAVRIGGSHEDR